MSDELFLHKAIKLLREQLEWKIAPEGGFYRHVVAVINSSDLKDISPEEFVARYRLKFKPKFKDHPTGGVFVDGHYGAEGDVVLMIGPEGVKE